MEEKRSDKISEYLVARLSDYVFDEFSDAYLEKAGLQNVLKGVPIPFRKDQLAEPTTSAVKIASNMAFVIGCDRDFKYKENYLAFIFRTFSKDFAIPLVNEGIEVGDQGDHELACVYFRAAMEIDPDLILAGRTLGMKEGEIFRRIILPSAGPGIFSGMKVGDPVTVMVNPADPTDVVTKNSPWLAVGLMAGGAVVLAIAAFSIVKTAKRNKALKLQEGEWING